MGDGGGSMGCVRLILFSLPVIVLVIFIGEEIIAYRSGRNVFCRVLILVEITREDGEGLKACDLFSK